MISKRRKRLIAKFIGVVSCMVAVPEMSVTLLLGDHEPLLYVLSVLQRIKSDEPRTV